MLSLDEYKSRVAGICEQLGGGLPYEADQIKADDWQELADELIEIASFVGSMANSLAAYAGNASKRAMSE